MLKRMAAAMILAFTVNGSMQAQDAEFSQFFANPLYLNPALAGSEFYQRAVANYRNQWPGIDNGFVTYNASYDQYVDKMHGGIGALVNVDNAGDGLLTTTQASLIYAYTLTASYNLFFNLALQASYYQRSLNWDKLRFGDQIDLLHGVDLKTAENPPDNTSVMAPDFAAGFVFGWKSFMHGGMAVHHMSEPDLAFYSQHEDKLPFKFTGHLGFNVNLEGHSMYFDPRFYISPNILYQQQGNFHQVNAGLYITWLPISLGAWYRHNFENVDAMIVLVGITHENLKIGYSYDLTLSEIRSSTGGAHEVSVAWLFNKKPHLRTIHPLVAPGF